MACPTMAWGCLGRLQSSSCSDEQFSKACFGHGSPCSLIQQNSEMNSPNVSCPYGGVFSVSNVTFTGSSLPFLLACSEQTVFASFVWQQKRKIASSVSSASFQPVLAPKRHMCGERQKEPRMTFYLLHQLLPSDSEEINLNCVF